MKVKISNYPNRLICNIHSNHMNKKYGYVDWPMEQTRFENFLEWLEDTFQSVYNLINVPFLDKRQQKVKVRIDPWDTWSMDHTLAPIILPMLKQLKETKHGAPYVESADVPKELRMNVHQKVGYKTDGTTDENFFKRWDWVMDEMIWAFEQKNRDHWEEDYYGPYIKGEGGGILGGRFEWTDDEGRKKHQERMSNGFRLFGKYYENLWD